MNVKWGELDEITKSVAKNGEGRGIMEDRFNAFKALRSTQNNNEVKIR